MVLVSGHINKAKLRWAILGLVTGLPSQYLSRLLRPTKPGHSSVGRCNE